MEIIDMRKYRRRRSAHLSRPRDTKFRRLQSHDAAKHDDNNRHHHENFSDHKILVWAMLALQPITVVTSSLSDHARGSLIGILPVKTEAKFGEKLH
jgi:hypothetical protein